MEQAEEPRLTIEHFKSDTFKGFFVEVIKDATNFHISSSKELNYTEVVFDDPTNYCIHIDAPMFEGVYEINGRIIKEGIEYVVITKTHFPGEELSYEERIYWYHKYCVLNRKKLENKPTLQELLEQYKDQKDIDYLPIIGTKFVEYIPRYVHEDRMNRNRPRIK